MKTTDKVDFEQIVTDPETGMNLLDHDDKISFDLETTGLSPWKDNIALMQFWGNNTKTPVLIRVQDGVVPQVVKDLFEGGGKEFIGHNVGGFDCLFLDTHNVPWQNNKWYDTLVGEGIISTTGRRDVSKSLKESVRRRLGLKLDKDIEHGGWANETLSEQQLTYAANDVIYLQDLQFEQVEKAKAQEQTNALEFEMELMPVVAQMSLNGLPLVEEVLDNWLVEQREAEKDHKKWLDDHLGQINYNSPKQILNATMGIGLELPDTKAETLQEMANFGEGFGAEFAEHLLAYRKPAQRLKMYSDSWKKMYITNDWVHSRFWQVGTDTLRFSSSDPNLQQVPKDGRKIFGNLPGLSIVNADYSQIEVRIAAEIAEDQKLKEMLDDEDVHTAVASSIFEIPAEQVSVEQRRIAKACTFTLLFGGGPKMLYMYARNMGSTMEQDHAYEIFSRFFETFDGLSQMRKRAYAMSENRRVVNLKLPNGAKRLLVGGNLTPQRILNTIVQGSAAIGLKQALLVCDKMGLTKYIGATVHDELVAAVPDNEVPEFKQAIGEAMVEGMHKIFPNMKTKVEVKHGFFWQS